MTLLGTLKLLATATVAVGLSLAPVSAASLSPVGSWQASTGEARVKVTMCGDGTELCAKLVWLSEKARTKENLPLLNDYVVNRAQPTGERNWKGTVRFGGNTASGKIELVSANSITVSGCKVVCKTFRFNRI